MEQAEEIGNRERAAGADDLKSRRVTLADGRYLIYYTFDDAPDVAPPHIVDEEAKRREPAAQPVATEERNV